MLLKKSPIIATIVALGLSAPSVNASEDAVATAAATPAGLNRAVANEANATAAKEAVEAVLAANKRHLDIRIISRTSVRTEETPETTVDGR